MKKTTEAEVKWLVEFIESDDCEMSLDDSGNPFLMFYGDEQTIKRVQEISRKIGLEGELSQPSEDDAVQL
jgi:hypothetical protein